MIRMYERIALVAAGGLVSGLIAAAVMVPPDQKTARPNLVHKIQKIPNEERASPAPIKQAQRFLPIKARGSETLLSSVNVRALDAHAPAPVNSAVNLDKTFSNLGYTLDSVRNGSQKVPRLFLASMPGDMAELPEVSRKKALFFKTVLPLVLQINREIKDERRRLWNIQARLKKGERLGPVDRLWLMVMAERYKVKRGNISELIKRVDIIPVSLALAQAAEESGWGTSRFARQGNAIFGQWTTEKDEGLVPEGRDPDKTHKVKSFPSLLASARAYARNLNTHRAYRQFRSKRNELRKRGKPIKGSLLVDALVGYSERGLDYVKGLRAIITVNKLKRLDEAILSSDA